MTTDPAAAVARPRTRRRHAAAGGRILAAGLSAAATLGLMGAMARTADPGTDPVTASDDVAAAPSVIGVNRTAGPTTAPRIIPTVAAPVTTSRAS